eukprot:gene23013-23429_t
MLVTFARDPYALWQMECLMWDLWMEWRDGVASNTGFPGICGFLVSGNGPQEAQGRGMWMEAVLHTVQRTQFASGRAAARMLGCDPDCPEYQLPLAPHHQRQRDLISRAREVQVREGAGEDTSSAFNAMAARIDVGRVAIKAAVAAGVVAAGCMLADAPGEYVTLARDVVVTKAVALMLL